MISNEVAGFHVAERIERQILEHHISQTTIGGRVPAAPSMKLR